jgi:hypothetical protein
MHPTGASPIPAWYQVYVRPRGTMRHFLTVLRHFWHSISMGKIYRQLQGYSKFGRYSLCLGIFLHFIIALPLATVGFITATTISMATIKTATLPPLTTSIPGEVCLSLVNSCLINWLRALGDAMVRIAAIEACVGTMFLWNDPLF